MDTAPETVGIFNIPNTESLSVVLVTSVIAPVTKVIGLILTLSFV
jgi:hypothetical protein